MTKITKGSSVKLKPTTAIPTRYHGRKATVISTPQPNNRFVAQVNASNNSWKDEYLTVIFGLILVAHFLPFTQDYMDRGWQILKNADPLFWYSVLAIISGSFGMNLTNKLKGKK